MVKPSPMVDVMDRGVKAGDVIKVGPFTTQRAEGSPTVGPRFHRAGLGGVQEAPQCPLLPVGDVYGVDAVQLCLEHCAHLRRLHHVDGGGKRRGNRAFLVGGARRCYASPSQGTPTQHG
jgi:hypothetical protein